MNHHTYNEARAYLLLGAISLTPSSKEQVALFNMVLKMERAKEPPEYIIRQLLAAMLDGISMGNWPGV